MTHYKWYDYKHVHITYIKQLSNNTKQTDKTKRSRKKKQTRTKGKRERERERERDVMNWVTFKYACVYVCICDAQYSSVTVH